MPTLPPIGPSGSQPILTREDYVKIKTIDAATQGAYNAITLFMTYDVAQGALGMQNALEQLCIKAEQAVHDGFNIVILTDSQTSKMQIAIPALLACSAVHQHLVKTGLRTSTGLVISTGSAREVHHFALLAGYGAEAVHPWLAYRTIASMSDKPEEAGRTGAKPRSG